MKINFKPDGFSEKLLLNLIDKLIFGIIAALAISAFQSFWTSHEQTNNRRTVILNSYSDSIIEQRKSLLIYLRGYLSLVWQKNMNLLERLKMIQI